MLVLPKWNGARTQNLLLILQQKPNHMLSNREMKKQKELQLY